MEGNLGSIHSESSCCVIVSCVSVSPMQFTYISFTKCKAYEIRV